MDNSIELLPCPFCGTSARIEYEPGFNSFWVNCETLECGAGYCEDEADAIRRWNTRATSENANQDVFRDILPRSLDTFDWPTELTAWAAPEVFIPKLIEAADILLHRQDYDGHGWEEHEYAWRAAQRYLEVVNRNGQQAALKTL